jgi:hypothetical protein
MGTVNQRNESKQLYLGKYSFSLHTRKPRGLIGGRFFDNKWSLRFAHTHTYLKVSSSSRTSQTDFLSTLKRKLLLIT